MRSNVDPAWITAIVAVGSLLLGYVLKALIDPWIEGRKAVGTHKLVISQNRIDCTYDLIADILDAQQIMYKAAAARNAMHDLQSMYRRATSEETKSELLDKWTYAKAEAERLHLEVEVVSLRALSRTERIGPMPGDGVDENSRCEQVNKWRVALCSCAWPPEIFMEDWPTAQQVTESGNSLIKSLRKLVRSTTSAMRV